MVRASRANRARSNPPAYAPASSVLSATARPSRGSTAR